MLGAFSPGNKRPVVDAAEHIRQYPLRMVQVKQDVHAGIRRDEPALIPGAFLP